MVHDVDVRRCFLFSCVFFSSVTPKQGTRTCARTCICTVRTTFCCFYPAAYSQGCYHDTACHDDDSVEISRYYKTHIKHSVVGILLLNCFCNPLPLLQLVSPHVFCILAASCTTWTSSQTDSLPRMTTRRNWTIARDKVVIFSSFKLLASSAPARL